MLLLATAMFVLVVDTSLDERVDLRGRHRPGHDRQRRAVRDRARGAGLGGVHPDQQQGRRPDRPQARLRPRAAGLRRRGAGHDAGPEPHGDRHLLGDHRRARRLAAPAGDAVADPRQLRGRRPEAGLRAGRRRRRHRRRDRSAARRVRHDLPVVAGRLRARGRHHRRRAEPDRAGPRRPLHRLAPGRRRRRGPVRRRHGRRRARDPRLAGGRRVRRPAHGARRRGAGAARPVAGPAQARAAGDAARPRPVPAPELHRRGHRSDAAAGHPGRRDDRPAAVPPDDARVQRPGGRPVAGTAVADHVRRGPGGRQESRRPPSGRDHPDGLPAGQRRDRASSSRSSRGSTAAGTS